MDLLPQVQKTIASWQMLSSCEGLLVAVSGGPDSVALLHLLWRLARKMKLELAVVHLHHDLRGKQADADQEYVRKLAAELKLPFFTEKVDVASLAKKHNLTVEEAGRLARYSFFGRIARELKINKLAVGHNADDQAETVLMNLLRGAGSRGLGGIAPLATRDGLCIVRPILECTREEIESYCRWAGLSPRIDVTNKELLYFRNRIRHRYLPLLEEENPALRRELAKTAQILRSEDEFLEQLAQKLVDGWAEGEIPIVALNEHIALVRRALKLAVSRWYGEVWSFEHIQQIISLGNREVEQTVSLPGSRQACRGEKAVIIQYPRTQRQVLHEYILPCPGTVWIPEWDLKLELQYTTNYNPGPGREYFLAREIKQPLYVRTRRPGDRFRPRGVGGTKKLKDWFVDAKIPPQLRERIPILLDQEGILWIVGRRRSSRALPREGERLISITVKE